MFNFKLFNLLSFLMALTSVGALQFNKVDIIHCIVAISLFVVCVLLSKFGKLDKFDVDFKNQKVSVDAMDDIKPTGEVK